MITVLSYISVLIAGFSIGLATCEYIHFKKLSKRLEEVGHGNY